MPPSQRTELPIPRELDELVMACLREGPEPAAAERGRAVPDHVHIRCRDEWTPDQAEHWWQVHLPQLTGPLTARTEN